MNQDITGGRTIVGTLLAISTVDSMREARRIGRRLVEERLAAAKAIRKTTESKKAFAFVVEHDIVAQDFVADRLMIFNGEAGLNGHAHAPTSLRNGMNLFLSNMNVTFRRDGDTGRPRVNKPDSKTDRMQREAGEYYYTSS